MTAPEAHNPELAVTRDEHSTCRLIVETMHEGAMTVSGDGVVVNANPGLQRMVGKSAEQLEGLDPTSLFTEPDATAVSHLISGNGYGHSTIEATLLGADHETPVLVSANTVRDGGHPTTVVILADLSEQHAAALELDESRRKYRMLLENSTAFVLETREGGVVSWVSPSVTSVLGWLPEQLVGRSLFEFFHPDEVAGARSLMQRVDAGQEAAGRTRLRTASGSYRWLRRTIRPVRDETGVVTSRVSGWQDVQGEVEVWRALESAELRLRVMTDMSSEIVFRARPDHSLDWVSPSVSRILDRTPESMEGHRFSEYVHPDDVESLRRTTDVESESRTGGSEVRVRRADGGYLWMWVSLRPDLRGSSTVSGWVGSARIVEGEHSLREALQFAEDRFRLMDEMSPGAVWLVNPHGRLDWVSSSVWQLLRREAASLRGVAELDLIAPADRPLLADRSEGRVRLRMITDDGSPLWVDLDHHPVATSEAEGTWVGIARDAHAEHDAREACAISDERFVGILDAAPVAVAEVDLDRRFVRVNDALVTMLGHDREWLLQHRLPDVLTQGDDHLDLRMRARVLAGVVPSETAEKRLRSAGGEELVVQHTIAAIRDPHGLPVSFLSHFIDITRKRRAIADLSRLQTHDLLTGLINRGELVSRLVHSLAHPIRSGSRVAVLIVGIDHLHSVNDNYGHLVGDTVVAEIGHRLAGLVRSPAIVGRFGGGEFAIVLPEVSDDADAIAWGSRIRQLSVEPVDIPDGQVALSITIGLSLSAVGSALAARISAPATVADELLRQADAALHRGRRGGLAHVVVYDSALDAKA